MYFPVILRDELLNLLLAIDNDGQSRRLYATDRRQIKTAALGIESGHNAGAIDTHEPVRFGAADGGIGQREQFAIVAQPFEALTDSRGSHRLKP